MADPAGSTRVCVLGLGAIGLPVALSLAQGGVKVLGVDTDPDRLGALYAGVLGDAAIRSALAQALECGTLSLATEPAPADIFLIITPSQDTQEAGVTHLQGLLQTLLPHLRPGALIVLESTTLPGVTRRGLVAPLTAAGHTVGDSVHVAHAPERIAVGAAMAELRAQPRVVAGATPACFRKAAAFYATHFGVPISYAKSLEAAELSKLLENAARHVQISLANEFATLGATLGVNVPEVIGLANTHTRVDIHQPGAGIGGHCLPYAARALAALGREMPLLEASLAAQADRPWQVVATLFAGAKVPERVAVWGLSYKPDVAETTAAPAHMWIKAFREAGVADVRGHDPLAQGGVSWEASVDQVDLLVLVIAHRIWDEYDVGQVAHKVRRKDVVDLCGALRSPEDWQAHGFRVRRLGVDV